MTYTQVMRRLRALRDPAAVAGMARFGINPAGTLGVPVHALRRLARELGTDRALARQLWASGVHEARILAGMVEDPQRLTRAQMDRWARAFDSWDVCDQCCLNLFRRSPHARAQALAWSGRPEEFVKRAGFALMAVLAVHEREAPDADFEPFLEAVEREAGDDRNYVRNAVSWALRRIGKRSPRLRRRAMAVARRLKRSGSRAARGVGSEALRELEARAG